MTALIAARLPRAVFSNPSLNLTHLQVGWSIAPVLQRGLLMTNKLTHIRNNVCPVCLLANTIIMRNGDPFDLHCARCGDYDTTIEAISALNELADDADDRLKIAEWIWSQNSVGGIPLLERRALRSIVARPLLPYFERAKRLLIYLAENTTKLDSVVRIDEPKTIQAMLQTFDHQEIVQISWFLSQRGWIVGPADGSRSAAVSGEGFIQAEEWKQVGSSSIQGFVAMWFNDELNPAWESGFRPAIEKAGYKPQRIDKKEHANKICDEIVAEIKRSRFVVADYTGHRGGVYYEAGYAAGRGLPVILTCRKDEMDKLHFDIRQYNCIDWRSHEELAARLQARIEALFGDGPLRNGGRRGISPRSRRRLAATRTI